MGVATGAGAGVDGGTGVVVELMIWMVWFLSVFVSTKSRQPHPMGEVGMGRSGL